MNILISAQCRNLIFFICPNPKGSEENQFAHLVAIDIGRGKQTDFLNVLSFLDITYNNHIK